MPQQYKTDPTFLLSIAASALLRFRKFSQPSSPHLMELYTLPWH